jgi:hypothetical protein
MRHNLAELHFVEVLRSMKRSRKKTKNTATATRIKELSPGAYRKLFQLKQNF